MEVVFSKRAMTALLVETMERITTETGGVFLGKYESGVWYVVETIDPGPNSIFEIAYFEYDQEYVNHLINKVSRLYKNQLDLIGLWHRHPGSLDSFTIMDDDTNIKYAKLSEHGAISGLVNIDSEFRLTMYHVSLPLRYKKIRYYVDDLRIPEEINALKDPSKYAIKLGKFQSEIRSGKNRSFKGLSEKAAHINVIKAIHEGLKKRTFSDTKPMSAKGFKGELPIEYILEQLESDLQFFENNKVDYSIVIGELGLLDLSLAGKEDGMRMLFGVNDEGTVVFTYNEITYKYYKGLFRMTMNR